MGVAQAAFDAAIAAIDQGVPLGRESREQIAKLLIPGGACPDCNLQRRPD